MYQHKIIAWMGFDNWAMNIIVNEIENGNIRDGFNFESDEYTLTIKQTANKYICTIRAYVPATGWKTFEHTI